ncbi:MAG: NifB/NifX family molybdenum-iron cluster-binding protein [Candidatus Brocadiaceae bacterium]|jgi:predicted Fe-Mo cluster-binding NifX family protein
MRVALPLADGLLARHFGHCQEFAIFDVNREDGSIEESDRLQAPPHRPGLLPGWLRDQGAEAIIAGGMGRRAQDLFARAGIEVVIGAPHEEPERIVERYATGRLETGENICDH